jgi:diguanylate cyclase (GGDEF)-like protein
MTLNVSTIQVAIWANYLCLLLVWAYIARSYPSLTAARSWRTGTLLATIGSSFGMLRGSIPDVFPVIFGNLLLVMSLCCMWIGVRQFYGRPLPVRRCIAVGCGVALLLTLNLHTIDNIATRLAVISFGQCYLLAEITRDVRRHTGHRRSPGADLVALLCTVVIAIHATRTVAALSGLGGPLDFVSFNTIQSVFFLGLVIAGTMAHFGLLLMAVDRLRAEVAELALADDLTGIANRRRFLTRLDEACAEATRSGASFALMVIDIDGFKAVNDTHGHGAGDECLRAFTRAVQSRLRPEDLLARTGGDEFCAILPAASMTDAALVARGLIKACRRARVDWNGTTIPLTTSIGIAAWSPGIGRDSARLIHDADQALYVAKKQGRDRLAVHEPSPAPLRAAG